MRRHAPAPPARPSLPSSPGPCGTRRATADRPRVRHRPRERGRGQHVRAGVAGALPGQDADRQGAFVPDYYGIGHDSLDNYLAMVSGQAPNARHAGRLPSCSPTSLPGLPSADGQVVGQGCVYPAPVKTIADQLEAKRPDLEGLHGGHGRRPGARQRHDLRASGDRRARHDPAGERRRPVRDPPQPVRLLPLDHRLAAHCAAHDVDARSPSPPTSRRPRRRRTSRSSPRTSATTATTRTCADGGPGGLAAADAFLRTWVPRIMASPAYQRDGAARDRLRRGRARATRAPAAASSPGPNTPAPGGPSGGPGRRAHGRGRCSRRFIAPGHGDARSRTTTTACCAASRTRSASPTSATPARPDLRSFGDDVFTG